MSAETAQPGKSLTIAASSSSLSSLAKVINGDPDSKSENDNANGEASVSQEVVVQKESPNDYIFINTIGEGSFSTVYRCKHVKTGKLFAAKVCEKRLIIKERKADYIHREKRVMQMLIRNSHPFFVQLRSTMMDSERLYFIMTLAEHGELLNYLKKLGSFEEEVARFYTAEIIVALEHLHKLGIIHRDLKPENILLGADMHILVSDFGSTKILVSDEDRPTPLLPQPEQPNITTTTNNINNNSTKKNKRSSFVGSADYVSPEVLNSKPVTVSCDFWALGCILYQMLSGLPPFRAPNEYLIFQRIIKAQYTFPDGFPEVPMSLVQNLIQLEPKDRLGDKARGGVEELKKHQFFTGTNWQFLHEETPPEILPFLPASGGSQSFHSRYKVPGHLQPGLDDKQLTRLLGLEFDATTFSSARPLHLMDFTTSDRERRLGLQRKENPYHRFVENNLILKSAIMEKKRGLFPKKRMFLLTDGPHIYYVDPATMILKGEIPWSKEMRTECKNFRFFFVHTPNRTYCLDDPNSCAIDWCNSIEQVRQWYFCKPEEQTIKM